MFQIFIQAVESHQSLARYCPHTNDLTAVLHTDLYLGESALVLDHSLF